jgi:penicillin amidase
MEFTNESEFFLNSIQDLFLELGLGHKPNDFSKFDWQRYTLRGQLFRLLDQTSVKEESLAFFQFPLEPINETIELFEAIEFSPLESLDLNRLDQFLIPVRTGIREILTQTSSDFDFKLSGLEDNVKIVREPSGMIHIEAENDQDLFFALGLVHAHDRLWQMDFQRRTAGGRLSEILGEDTLQTDIFQRTLGIYDAAESAFEHLEEETQNILRSYSEGINKYLELDLPLPFEFQLLDYTPESWDPVDTLALFKLQSLGLSANFQFELARLQLILAGFSFEQIQSQFPLYTGDVTILNAEEVAQISGLSQSHSKISALSSTDRSSVVQGEEIEPGLFESIDGVNYILGSIRKLSPHASNNWVVSGELTTTGKPFLANDPHLSLDIPSIWHAVHLDSPNFNVIGASFPGIPGVAIGRNQDIAWGTTNAQVDVQDLYLLDESQIKLRDFPHEKIKVKGGQDITIQVRESVYGPVISDALGIPIPLALRWVSLDEEDDTIEAFLEINQAQNWEEFTTALESYIAPSQNFVYADVEGNIGYITPGKIPIRNLEAGPTLYEPEHTGLTPVPGTGQFDWLGFIPFEELPQAFNPDKGYIVTANNRIAPDNYPYQLGFEWAEPYRAERIEDLILSKDKLAFEDMQAIQLDQVTLLFRDFKPILKEIKPLLKDEPALEWLNRLLSWDGNLTAQSKEGTVFETWYTKLATSVLEGIDLPQGFPEGSALEALTRFLLNALDPNNANQDPNLLSQAAALFKTVIENFGNEIPRWGEIHQAVFEHSFLDLNRQVPFGGDRYTVNVGGYDPETFLMDSGASYRQVIELKNLDQSLFINPIGQSGRLLSPFFDNLLEPWLQGEYIPMPTEDFPVAVELNLEPSATEFL